MRFKILVLVLFAVLISSCDKKGGPSSESSSPSSSSSGNASSASYHGTDSNALPAQNMIVRTGTMQLGSSEPSETIQKITQIVSGVGGYVETQSLDHERYHATSGRIVVKIPVAHFDSALVLIRKTGNSVLNESIEAENVSNEYYDVSGRLAAKKAELAQLQELYKSAKSMQDIASIKSQVLDLEKEIDELGGQTKTMEHNVAYSTLSIFISNEGERNLVSRIGDAFSSGFSSFGDVLAGTIQFVIGGLPAIAALFGFIYLIVWLSQRADRRRAARYRNPVPAEKTTIDETIE